MKKRIKTKRKLKWKYKLIFSVGIFLLTFFYVFRFLYNKFLAKLDNEYVINSIVNYNLNTKKSSNLFYDILNLNSTNFLLKYTFGIEPLKEEPSDKVSGIEADYIEDPYPNDVKEPKVYIYNTHQTEGYQKSNNASYNPLCKRYGGITIAASNFNTSFRVVLYL